jgi:hypothetical protein
MLIAALMAALALADYPLAISGLALCGAWGLFAAIDRDWRSAVVAGAGIATAMITVAASLANAARYPIYPSPYFQPFAGLVRDLAVVNGTALLPCVAMLGLALVQIRRERLPLRGASAGTPWLRILILATVLTAAALIVVNAATHSLIRRQIFGIVPLVVAWLVELSLPHLKRRPLTVVLIGVNLLAVAAGTALALQWKPYFDRFAPRMAQAQQSCPTLPIYAVLPENIVGTRDNRFPMPDQVAIGYRDVTDRYDLRVRTAVPRDWVDPRCGAIIWSEYLWLNAPPTPQLIAGKLGLDPRSLRGVTIEYVDQSMLMRVPPPATP